MTNEGIKIVTGNLVKKSNELKSELQINRKRLFGRAWYLVKTDGLTLSQALKQVWKEIKEYKYKVRCELDSITNKLLSFFTPIEYHKTSEYMNEQMTLAHSRGTNLNK